MIKKLAIGTGCLVLLLVGGVLLYKYVIDRGHVGPPTISRETTFVTGPIDSGGYVIYDRALNEMRLADIRPEENAAVGIVECLGPQADPAWFKWTWETVTDGQKFPAGPFFVSFDEFVSNSEIQPGKVAIDFYISNTKAVQEDPNQSFDYRTEIDPDYDFSEDEWGVRTTVLLLELDRANEQPFDPQLLPTVTMWLEKNREVLNKLVEAAQLEKCFIPWYSNSANSLASYGPSMEANQMVEALGSALSLSAKRHIHENDFDTALDEIVAIRRLGRLLNRQIFQGHVHDQIAKHAHRAEHELFICGKLTGEQIIAFETAIASLPAPEDKIRFVDNEFRMSILSEIQRTHTEFDDDIDYYYRQNGFAPDFDIDIVMRGVNDHIDLIVQSLKDSTPLPSVNVRGSQDARTSLLQLLGGGATRGRQNAEALIQVYMLNQANEFAHPQEAPGLKVVRTALAIERYKIGKDAYPDSLETLVPDYLDAVPIDPLRTGTPLVYQRTTDGFRIYSVGDNGTDDSGIGVCDPESKFDGAHPNADDICIRVGKTEAK